MQNDISQKELGKWGESVARDYLIAKGYGILEQNWKMGRYEVDIIAMTQDQIVFVEVKTRRSPEYDPVQAVDKRKRQRTIASADMYLQIKKLPFEFRFDIVSVIGSPGQFAIEHIPDAYFPPLKRISYHFRL